MNAFFLAVVSVTQSLAQVGTFAVAETVDPISDKGQAIAILTDGAGNNLKIGCLGTGEKRVIVALETEAFLATDDPFYSPIITVRFGTQEPEFQKWNVEHHQAYIRLSKPVAKFARNLRAVDRLVVRMDKSGGGFEDAIFSVSGARDALLRVARTCGDTAFERAIIAP